MATRPHPTDRLFDAADVDDSGRSNFAAFLLGGVVIAGSLLAFLYYDTGNLGPADALTTGSIATREAPAPAIPSIKIPVPSNAANPQ